MTLAQRGSVLITGGSGFLGKVLARRLIEHGSSRVKIFDKRPPEGIDSFPVSFVGGDVTSPESVARAMEGVEYVFNLVSLLPCSRAGNQFWRVNVDGTEHILREAERVGVRKIVHVSTSVVYGIPGEVPLRENSVVSPIGDYGRSKLAAERLCIQYMDKVSITILRPRFIIGPGRLGILTVLFDWIAAGKKIYIIGSGNNHFQMLSVDDLVEACVSALDKGKGEIFNIGGTPIPTVRELLGAVILHAQTSSKIVSLPAELARTILRSLDWLHLVPLGTEHYMIADKEYILDTSKAQRILGWYPKDDIVQKMIEAYDWYRTHKQALRHTLPSDFPKQKLLKALKWFS